MSNLFEGTTELTEREYKSYRILKIDTGWKIFSLNKTFSNIQEAELYIDKINATIEQLYIAVCKGDFDAIRTYFNSKKTAQINRRYLTSSGEVSLLMAAFRNRMYNICTYLVSVGETVTNEEFEEITPRVSQALAIVQIFQVMQDSKRSGI